MTPAIVYLKQHQQVFRLYDYEADPSAGNYGLASAEKLGLDPQCVFKTLLACNEQNPKQMVVAVVPVTGQLDLKRLAKAAGMKKMQMCELALAERSTGYVKGGISPFAQKRVLPTFVDSHAQGLAEIVVSAGKRGLSVGIAPQVVVQLLNGEFVSLTSLA